MSNLLLDTNGLIRYAAVSKNFGKRAIRLLDQSQLFFSPLSLVELKIKELRVPGFRSSLTPKVLSALGFSELPYDSKSWEHLDSLATKDPFDMLLVSQAKSRGMKFMTADQAILESELDFVVDLTE